MTTDTISPPTDRSGVIVVGSATVDLTTFSQRLPARGETVLGDDFSLVLGGKGANQAVAAGRAGARASMVACIGSDLFRDLVLDALRDAGVDTTFVRSVDGPTGVAHIRVDASGENDIVMVPLANSSLDEAHIDEAVADRAATSSVLLTQLETPIHLVRHTMATARAAGLTTILDPAPAQPLDDDIWSLVDVVTPNETEAAILTGATVSDDASAEAAGRWFVDRGVRCAIVTRAADGATLVSADAVTHLPAIAVTAVDTTAAGDAFAGYLGAALASGASMDEAARVASAAGALAVTRRGASPSIPRRSEVDERRRHAAG
ncbi:ribokinase [Labedella gwakjiensis]|uniref:Ribokinase n=1 Tax=Labedella gwakjiensis TaxID=390269 RepID=A0A2P8GWU3_9MICO|nr:ribokinase [Labedella gwakjiensis]PSL38425.1 ribokinase [Labedella gwakjiensis]RUQ87050.1 ribokinase [Labedella gwakjiensis]